MLFERRFRNIAGLKLDAVVKSSETKAAWSAELPRARRNRYVRRNPLIYRKQLLLFYFNPHNLDSFGFSRLVGGVRHLCHATADFLQ